MIRGCLMFVFTLVFVSLFAFVAGIMAFKELGRSEVVVMPSLIGMSQQDAVEAINTAGLTLEDLIPKEDNEHPPGTVIRQHPAPFTDVKSKRGVTVYVSVLGRITQVPEIRGLDERNVPLELSKSNLGLDTTSRTYHPTVDAGKVIATFPPTGAEVSEYSGVDILVSRGPGPKAYVMPDVFNMSESDARKELDSAGIPITRERVPVKSEYLVGDVIDQSPEPGMRISTDEPVTLKIGFLQP
jgi:serine/threonine-protein kinase